MAIKKEIFLFIGPPGSGKGTLANICVKNSGWEQLSTGNLCRKHIQEQTEIGRKIDFAIKSGKLVSDELVSEMVENWLIENISHMENVILDGYPRTVRQAQFFDQFFKNRLEDLKLKVIRFAIADDVVVNRLMSRYVCSNKNCQAVYSLAKGSQFAPKHDLKCDSCGGELVRRSDDTEEAIRNRLKVYHLHETDLLDFYKNQGYQIVEIDSEKQMDEVFQIFNQCVGV